MGKTAKTDFSPGDESSSTANGDVIIKGAPCLYIYIILVKLTINLLHFTTIYVRRVMSEFILLLLDNYSVTATMSIGITLNKKYNITILLTIIYVNAVHT